MVSLILTLGKVKVSVYIRLMVTLTVIRQYKAKKMKLWKRLEQTVLLIYFLTRVSFSRLEVLFHVSPKNTIHPKFNVFNNIFF